MEKIGFSEDIKKAVECLQKGGVILYPTDTIWGIGCDATNSEAVKKIYSLKKRDDSKSMLVLVDNINSLEKIVYDIPQIAVQLIEMAKDPLTIIYDHPKGVAPELISKEDTLGVRITSEKFSNELCRRLGKPIVSTSANISGDPSAHYFDEISSEIKKGVDYIVNYRREDKSVTNPSNIIRIGEGGHFTIIR